MDLFENKMDLKKFSSTNLLWNTLKLNYPWSIGRVSQIIYNKKFKTKEEWEEYYFYSGEIRKNKINELNDFTKNILSSNEQPSIKLKYDILRLNLDYGRTKNDLMYKAFLLYDAISKQGNPLNISFKECIYIIKYRIICETWNGIMIREKNTIKTIASKFNKYNLNIIKTKGNIDVKYEVDYEIYFREKLICGLQIKPLSYKKFNSSKLKEHNLKKNKEYEKEFHVPVFYIYSKENGKIENLDELSQINDILNSIYR